MGGRSARRCVEKKEGQRGEQVFPLHRIKSKKGCYLFSRLSALLGKGKDRHWSVGEQGRRPGSLGHL